MVFTWEGIGMVVLIYQNPFGDRFSRIGKMRLQLVNLSLTILPMINRYVTILDKLVLGISGVIAGAIPIILLIITVIQDIRTAQ
jgi:hypothetical protein